MSDNTALKEDINNIPDETPVSEVDEIKANSDRNKTENKSATIHVSFRSSSDQISIKSKATGETNKVAAANRKIRLISGRLYFIPIDHKDIDSDEYGNMKQFSDTSDKFEVLYVKDGVACIDPVLHNALIEDGQRICIVW
jgi:hypothetical protein